MADETVINVGTPMHCPHCGNTLDDNVEDWAIAGRAGPESRAKGDCAYCDRLFSVENLGDGNCKVTQLPGFA